MADTTIEWTDKTWNPTVGCSRISAGCKNCYAFALHDMRHEAYKAGKKMPKQYAKPFTELQMMEDRLATPLSWRKPCRVFVNSVSDLFHEDVPDKFIRKVFAIMSLAGQHTFQVLTKRAERMAAWFADPENDLSNCQAEWVAGDTTGDMTPTGKSRIRDTRSINGAPHKFGDGNYWPLPNVWLGVSVENQEQAEKRIPLLLQAPAAVRFLSCEPLLGPVDLTAWLEWGNCGPPWLCNNADTQEKAWVIVGGESGHNARPCNLDWVRDIVQQCKAASVPLFVKQMGSKPYQTEDLSREPCSTATFDRYLTLKDPKGGDINEFPKDLRVREFPEVNHG